MRVEVAVYLTLMSKLGWSFKTLKLPGSKTRLVDVLEALPELKQVLISDKALNQDFKVLVDGVNVRFLGGLNAEIRDGSRLVVFPPVGGG